MTLKHPTMAEIALQRFRSGEAPSLAYAAQRLGADVERVWPSTVIYTFDDDTSIVTKGQGRHHKVEVLLP